MGGLGVTVGGDIGACRCGDAVLITLSSPVLLYWKVLYCIVLWCGDVLSCSVAWSDNGGLGLVRSRRVSREGAAEIRKSILRLEKPAFC